MTILRRIGTLLVALTATLVACLPGEPTSPETKGADQIANYEPPIAFQEGDLVVGRGVYPTCPQWDPDGDGWDGQYLPPGDYVTLDLAYGSNPAPPAPRLSLPLSEKTQVVRELGGEIIWEPNVATFRASIPRSSLVALGESGAFAKARVVPDPDRFDLFVTIHGEQKDVIQARFEGMGGFIRSPSIGHPWFRGVIPADSVEVLREMPEVSGIELGRVAGCVFHEP